MYRFKKQPFLIKQLFLAAKERFMSIFKKKKKNAPENAIPLELQVFPIIHYKKELYNSINRKKVGSKDRK